MKTKFFSLTWSDYLNVIQVCLNQIEIKPDFIFAPVRGGLIPAVIASHNLHTKMYAMEPKSLDKTLHPYLLTTIKTKKLTVLLIDDISDTGATLIKCKTYLEELGYFVITCTPVIKENTQYRPDHFIMTVPKDRWVLFPYERETSEKKSIKKRSR